MYLYIQSFLLVLAILFINNVVPFLYQSKCFIDNQKLNDLNYLITFFEKQERYEDCALLVKIRDKIEANEELYLSITS